MIARLAMMFLMRGGLNELFAGRGELDYKQPKWRVTICDQPVMEKVRGEARNDSLPDTLLTICECA